VYAPHCYVIRTLLLLFRKCVHGFLRLYAIDKKKPDTVQIWHLLHLQHGDGGRMLRHQGTLTRTQPVLNLHLTPQSRILLEEKLTVSELVKKFHAVWKHLVHNSLPLLLSLNQSRPPPQYYLFRTNFNIILLSTNGSSHRFKYQNLLIISLLHHMCHILCYT
jgi:hypothetical protein